MQRYEGLDALRGVAAVLVLFIHYGLYPGIPTVSSAYLAVDVFFSLSGFVIAANYDSKLKFNLGRWDFVLKRLFRFYPIYIIGVAISLVSMVLIYYFGRTGIHPDLNFWNVLPNLFMLPSMNPSDSGSLLFVTNIVAWSLFFELVANIFYAYLIAKNSNYFLVVCILLSLLFLILNVIWSGAGGGHDWGTFWNGLSRSMFSFLTGVLIFRLRYKMGVVPKWMMALTPVLLVLVAVIDPPPQYDGIYSILIVTIVMPFLVFAASGQKEFPIARNLFAFLAYISYALYVIHVPINRIASGVYTRTVEGSFVFSVIFGLMICVCAIVVAFATTRFDEYVRGILYARSRPATTNA